MAAEGAVQTRPVIRGGLGGNDDPRESGLLAGLRDLRRNPARARKAWEESAKARAGRAAAAGRTAEAIRLYERARTEMGFDDPDIVLSLAELRTIRRLERRLELRPNDAAALAELAKVYFVQEHDALVQECLARLLRVAPRHADGHWMLGVSLHFRGEYEEAAREYRLTLQLQPGHQWAAHYLPQAEGRQKPDAKGFGGSAG